jgi:hypothetical protein
MTYEKGDLLFGYKLDRGIILLVTKDSTKEDGVTECLFLENPQSPVTVGTSHHFINTILRDYYHKVEA